MIIYACKIIFHRQCLQIKSQHSYATWYLILALRSPSLLIGGGFLCHFIIRVTLTRGIRTHGKEIKSETLELNKTISSVKKMLLNV